MKYKEGDKFEDNRGYNTVKGKIINIIEETIVGEGNVAIIKWSNGQEVGYNEEEIDYKFKKLKPKKKKNKLEKRVKELEGKIDRIESHAHKCIKDIDVIIKDLFPKRKISDFETIQTPKDTHIDITLPETPNKKVINPKDDFLKVNWEDIENLPITDCKINESLDIIKVTFKDSLGQKHELPLYTLGKDTWQLIVNDIKKVINPSEEKTLEERIKCLGCCVCEEYKYGIILFVLISLPMGYKVSLPYYDDNNEIIEKVKQIIEILK